MLPIELICNVTGFPTWEVTINGIEEEFTPNALGNGRLAGHDIHVNGSNILINVPVNNSKYICVSNVDTHITQSDPAFLYISGQFASPTVIATLHDFIMLHMYICV